jgi:prepilin-type N-terminal cleavage/methylation domain-containing protein
MMRSDSVARCRTGFTLIETLLALALSSVLIMAVFALVDSTVTYHVQGSDQVLTSQRMLGLMQDLRQDIRAVVADPHWTVAPKRTVTDERLATMERMASHLQLSNNGQAIEPIRLVGDSNWLVLTLAHANPRWPNDPEFEHQVVWSLSSRQGLTIPTHDDHGRAIKQILPASAAAGLLRTRLPAAPTDHVSPQADQVLLVQQFALRYLSNGRWKSSWNSSAEKRLPDAIEVTLLLPHESQRRTWLINTARGTP